MKKPMAICLVLVLCMTLAGCGSVDKTAAVSAGSAVAVGDVCFFGVYEQDNDLNDGKEPIEWLVLDIEGDKALLLSKYGLDAKPYNATYADVTWETCTLRAWLNDDFLKTAFTEDEQKAIFTTDVDNSANKYSDRVNIITSVIYDENSLNDRMLVINDTVYLGTRENGIKAFDSSGELRWEQSTNGAIQAMRYDDELKWLIVGSHDRNVYVYDAVSGEPIASYNVNGLVYDMDYEQRTGRLLVSSRVSATKQTIYVFDIKTGEELFKYQLKQESKGTRYSSDYSAFYYGDARGRLFKVDFEGNQLAKNQAKTEIVSMAVVPGTGEVYALDKNNCLFKFDKDLNEILNVKLGGRGIGRGRCIDVSDDGRWVGVGTEDGDFCILDGDGNICYTERFRNDLTQVYFSDDTGYVVLPSPMLYKFTTSSLGNEDCDEKETVVEKNTQDRVFLFNYAEANKYLGAEDDSQYNTKSRAVPTAYAVLNGAYIDRRVTENGPVETTEWWLRSPSFNLNRAALVYTMDSLSHPNVDTAYGAVRPAMWVKTSAVTMKPVQKNTDAAVGDVYTFGSYELNNNTADGKELIDWLILDVAGDGALTLISKYALGMKPYNTERTDVAWATCSLRKWLNEDFYDAAFSAEEKAKIQTVRIINEDNPTGGSDGGADTEDKVWLPGINEVTDSFSKGRLYSLFGDDESRICMSRKYGVLKCYWWLRSPGYLSTMVAFVCSDGHVDDYGLFPDNYDLFFVRPVIVIRP